ncbi:MAG: hypothetical protein GX610_13785 [Rhodococcus sp.]|nr:hypothetical protein [Rhodococcus sp. (in: high G+C Gram-positive bacteria)]
MGEMTTAEASALLGVSTRQTARIVASGEIAVKRRAGSALLLDSESVQRAAQISRAPGRVWSEPVAWAAFTLLSGGDASWLAASQRTRLRHKLRNTTADEVAALGRHRARVHRFRVHTSAIAKVEEQLIVTGDSALSNPTLASRFGLTAGRDRVDGYTTDAELKWLVDTFGLVADPCGNATVRVVRHTDAFGNGHTPLAAIATDVMDSLSTRERSAGRRVLQELLDAR